jgi:hypothetical protein
MGWAGWGCCVALIAAAGCNFDAGQNLAYGCGRCAMPDRCVRGFCLRGLKPTDSGQDSGQAAMGLDASSAVGCKPEGDSRSCYEGPPGTQGNGRCRAGAQLCQGGVWGQCSGQLLPEQESCNAYDDDCDGRTDEDFDLQTSSDNCGVCNHRCPTDRTCCNAICSDLQTDAANCGACATACIAGNACCAGACRDTQSDPSNCGTCGAACSGGETCCGTCQSTQTDPNHCGAACAHCAAGEGCCAGTCTDLASSQHCGTCEAACNPDRELCCNHACTTDLQMCGDI